MNTSRIYFILVFLSVLIGGAWAQCPTGDRVFSSQQQLIDFAKSYPDCAEISGDVVIGTSYGMTDIDDLSPLANIRSIDGYLNILNNPVLTTLNGLESLMSIGGYLNIFNNEQLNTLDGLENLTSVNGFLWILHNQTLSSLEGLHRLTSINGSLDISNNPMLYSLNGLENINYRTISMNPSFLLTPVIDINILNNGDPSMPLLPNMETYQENNGTIQKFRSMIHTPYSERALETDLIHKRIEGLTDTTQAYELLRQLASIAHASGDRELIWESELLTTFYQLIHGVAPFPQRIAQMKELADRAGHEGVWQIQARALKLISLRYWIDLLDYEKTFKTYRELQQVLQRMTPEEFPDLAQCYMIMGRAHFYFRDYRTAIHFFQKGAIIPQTPLNTTFVTHCINNLGLCYQNLNILDSSDFYLNQLVEDTNRYAIEVWRGIASGNLGYNYYLRNEYDKAFPLLQRDVYTAESIKDWGLAAGSLIPLADILVMRNQLTHAEELIHRAREYIHRSGQDDRLRLLFPIISKWHSAMGHQDLAANYVDTTLQAIQVYHEKFNALKVMRAEQELNARELRLKEVEKQNLIQQRNLVLVIVLGVFVFGLIIIWYRNKSLQRKRKIRELALQNAKESLEHAQTRLGDLTRKIRENNQLIDKLKINNQISSDPNLLHELQNVTILTNDDWTEFKNHFQSVYPGFLEIIKTRYSELTPAEIRYLCLLKLGLSNHEMASALGVSPKSINVTKYRIRKKLDLENQEILEKMVNSI